MEHDAMLLVKEFKENKEKEKRQEEIRRQRAL